jgi:hypothetical protein
LGCPRSKVQGMPLDKQQINSVDEAIHNYDFPCVIFDFLGGQERQLTSMLEVETVIRSQLVAGDVTSVRDGLSNVLYWGYARTGFRNTRVRKFRREVDEQGLYDASELFRTIHGPAVKKIKELKLPEFAGLSFVSKVRMFLDPADYVVLDLQLLKLREQPVNTVFREIIAPNNPTTIRITRHNESIYEHWSRQCRHIAARYFAENRFRAVDIERGIFQMMGAGQARIAAGILSDA